MLRLQTYAAVAALACLSSIVGCGGSDASSDTGATTQELKKKKDGSPSGNGVTCSWDGVPIPVAGGASGGGSVPPYDPGAPPAGCSTPPDPGTPPNGCSTPPYDPNDPNAPDAPTCNPPQPIPADGNTGNGGAPVGSGNASNGGTAGGQPGQVPPAPGCAPPPPPPYHVGDHFPSPDGCNICTCTPNGIACTAMYCPPPPPPTCGGGGPGGGGGGGACSYGGAKQPIGATFPSADGCNSCSCTPSGVVCTERACAK